MPLESDALGLRAGKPEVFLQTSFNERSASFSPDGRWVAYYSDESGVDQVYVRGVPDTGGKWKVSNAGGAYPEWSRTGREIFYRTNDNKSIMVASFTAKDDAFLASKPSLWAETRLLDVGRNRNYDLAPDGKHIVALMPVGTPESQQAQSHVIFLENFFDELWRKVPVGK